jgi:Bacterial aa3 type cytochrome c oxidase subunit IV
LPRRCPADGFEVCDINKDILELSSWGTPMADHGEIAYSTADGNDYPAHEQTYVGFIKLVKFGTIGVVIIVALMAIFLT